MLASFMVASRITEVEVNVNGGEGIGGMGCWKVSATYFSTLLLV